MPPTTEVCDHPIIDLVRARIGDLTTQLRQASPVAWLSEVHVMVRQAASMRGTVPFSYQQGESSPDLGAKPALTCATCSHSGA